LRTLFAWQRRKARAQGIKQPLCGAVTFCQRYGSLLQFTPHFHSWLPDGVFALDDSGALQLHEQLPPDDAEVAALAWRIGTRIEALLAAAEDNPPELDEQTEALLAEQARASLLLPPLSSRLSATEGVRGLRCAAFSGYSLHANLAVEKRDRKMLERLLRYGLRPPFAQRRLSLTTDGKVRLALRKPTFSGQRQLVMEPLDFLRRLVATIPPRRMNLVRFHGVFAPHAKARPALQALLPALPPPRAAANAAQVEPVDQSTAQGDAEVPSREPLPPRYRRPWHELLKRVLDLSVLICPRCGHKMHRISHIEQPPVIARILDHLNLPATMPAIAPARAPPQQELDLLDLDERVLCAAEDLC
jgi:hypothetical protein